MIHSHIYSWLKSTNILEDWIKLIKNAFRFSPQFIDTMYKKYDYHKSGSLQFDGFVHAIIVIQVLYGPYNMELNKKHMNIEISSVWLVPFNNTTQVAMETLTSPTNNTCPLSFLTFNTFPSTLAFFWSFITTEL